MTKKKTKELKKIMTKRENPTRKNSQKGYHYTQCGLDNVWLSNGFKKDKDGHICIHDILGLHAAIGMALIQKKNVLSGKEVKYIRHHMDLSQTAFGERFGVSYQTILGWEKEKTEVPEAMDKFLKVTYFSFLNRENNKDLYDFFTELSELDAQEHDDEINFAEIENTWSLAA